MKKLLVGMGILVFLGFSLFSYDFQGSDKILGTWVNVNSSTKGITKISITKHSGTFYVNVWGKCHPSDCEWGKTVAYTFAGSLRRDPGRHFKSLLAIYKFRESERYLILSLSGGRLRVRLLVRYPLNERKNSDEVYTFYKRTPAPPMRIILPAPNPIAPADGAVFHHFPRRTTLRWSPVRGAASYTVEIYYIEPCARPFPRRCTPKAVKWKVVSGIHGTSYTFNFVGAQPGKWRVWAVDSHGVAGQKSRWMHFRYTR